MKKMVRFPTWLCNNPTSPVTARISVNIPAMANDLVIYLTLL